MEQPIKTIPTYVAVAGALVMILVSATLNYLFLSSQGQAGLESKVIGGVSVAADLVKAVMPLFIVWGFYAKRWGYVAITVVGFLFIATFSLTNAIGFMAQNRSIIIGAKEALAGQYASAVKQRDELEEKFRRVSRSRPPEVVAELMRGMEQDRRWTTSNQCTDATALPTRGFCSAYFDLRSERAGGAEAKKLESQLKAARDLVDALKSDGAANESDAQASIIARLLGMDQEKVRSGLVLFAALLIEFCSGMGLFWAVGHGPAFLEATHGIPNGESAPSPYQATEPPPAPVPAEVLPPQPKPLNGGAAAVPLVAETPEHAESPLTMTLAEPPRVELTIPNTQARPGASAPGHESDDDADATPRVSAIAARVAEARQGLRSGAFRRRPPTGDLPKGVTPFSRPRGNDVRPAPKVQQPKTDEPPPETSPAAFASRSESSPDGVEA